MGMLDFTLDDAGDAIRAVREAITGKKIIDPEKQMELTLKLKQLEQALQLGQIQINVEEAKHPSKFVAGWRPAIGWVAAVSIALMYIPKAIVMTWIWTYQCIEIVHVATDVSKVVLPTFPELGAMDIIGLVSSLLGIGIMRSYDKTQGTDTKRTS